ncbi:MAG: peptidoglycan-binding protein [Pseudomonadota bacterium]
MSRVKAASRTAWLCALAIGLMGICLSLPARAQSQAQEVWIQVEARSSQSAAEARLADYRQTFARAAGYRLRTGWYAILLGPFDEAEARFELNLLKDTGQIPADSYLQFTSRLSAAFDAPAGSFEGHGASPTAPLRVTALPQDGAIDLETPQDARRSEARLPLATLLELQRALKWAGTYRGKIDGRFGRGTRASMSAWQSQNGFEPTGILTTAQRTALFAAYNAVFDGLGFAEFSDPTLGIEAELPLSAFTFERYEAPMAHFTGTGLIEGAALALISQSGTRESLQALYDVLETLEVMPEGGPRRIGRDGFVMQGLSSRRQSYASLRYEAGEIKGFLLQWPAGDTARQARVAERIDKGLRLTRGVVMPSALGRDETTSQSLLVGYAPRTALAAGSGVFISSKGHVLTHQDTVAACGRIEINDEFAYSVQATDPASGIALLSADTELAPQIHGAFSAQRPTLDAQVVLGGYSYGGALGGPSATFGTLQAAEDLRGNFENDRLSMPALPGDIGGPVVDDAGNLTGLLLPRPESQRQLPSDVAFARDADTLLPFLTQAGVQATLSDPDQLALPPEYVAQRARDITVLVKCWE